MSYYQYEQTRQYGNAIEDAKKPGQKFCNAVGWKLTQSKYREIQRPDKVTMMGGTIYRTITPTTHCWYKNNSTGEHIWIEFSSTIITVKRGIRVTTSQGLGFGQVFLHPDSEDYQDKQVFYSNGAACDYLLGL
jgi:hypothetical protein